MALNTRVFSLVIPSYNGGAYLQLAVQSALGQDYSGPYQVVVLDDDSQDGTLDFLRSIRDDRFSLIEAPEHLGITGNWLRLREVPLGDYFAIFGQDDIPHPNYLSGMDALIEREPDATLYHAHFNFIDDAGQEIRPARPMPPRESAGEYLMAMFSGGRDSHGAGYMISTEHYRSVGGIPPWHKLLFADDALWLLLMSRGFKACSLESLFSVRLHVNSTGNSSSAQDWMTGLEKYAAFLENLRAGDASVGAALDKFQGSYFETWSNVVLGKHYVERTRLNRRADADFVNKMGIMLEKLPSERVLISGGTKKVRIHRIINRWTITRHLYNMISRRRDNANQ